MKPAILGFLGALALASTSQAITIQLDYEFAGNFYNNNPAARAALEKAAADLSNALTPSLNSVNQGFFTSDLVDLSWGTSFTNPSADPVTGPIVEKAFSPIAADVVKIYVGAFSFANPGTLGVGGPVSMTLEPAWINGASKSQLQADVDKVSAESNAVIRRPSGPQIGTISGTLEASDGDVKISLVYGLFGGTLTMDTDADWHFDINSPVEAGKFDFYSVALHEMVHALGFGTSETWGDQASGANWSGSNVNALVGNGMDLLSLDHPGHIADGTMSFNIYTGIEQEALMDPNILPGTRKELTALDLAFLRDLGYGTIVAVPEPGTGVLFAFAAVAVTFALRRSRRGVSA